MVNGAKKATLSHVVILVPIVVVVVGGCGRLEGGWVEGELREECWRKEEGRRYSMYQVSQCARPTTECSLSAEWFQWCWVLWGAQRASTTFLFLKPMVFGMVVQGTVSTEIVHNVKGGSVGAACVCVLRLSRFLRENNCHKALVFLATIFGRPPPVATGAAEETGFLEQCA